MGSATEGLRGRASNTAPLCALSDDLHKKNVLTAALPPFVEGADRGIFGREMGAMEASLKANATHMARFTSSGS